MSDLMEIDAPPKKPAEQKHPYLPDLPDLEEEYYGEFKWSITNYSQLREQAMANTEAAKVYSPEHEIHGELWRVLLFPNGNNVDQLSLYLDFASSKNQENTNWHRCTQLVIRLANTSDSSICVHKDAKHRYSSEESDWGFTSYFKIAQLTIPFEGNSRPLMENDAFDLYVYFRVLKDPLGILWNNFNKFAYMRWDSKQQTGYVGLRNQGATCYMNSLLQSLYFTNYFRKAVFQIPTDADEPSKSVALALQRVFYNLQHHPDAVDTRELTKSFGWDSMEAFMQHDVQEFNRVLQDNLETKMKKTKAEGAIERLFVGKMKSYIKCVNVDYESSREETFYDIQLNVKGKANLYESFKDYIAVEMLDGENKYQSETYGLQDAKKGVIFTKYPPVLHLQLKRFEYDFQRDAMVKINDRFEFPLEINLTEFLDESSDKSVKQEYVLHGVLVHSGDVHGGHYYAILKPTVEDKWFKFDDDRVVPVPMKEVLEDNYGEKPSAAPTPVSGTPPLVARRIQLLKKFTNAYMLVYIRKADLPEILKEVGEHDIPSYLSENLKRENELKERMAKEAAERHMYVNVRLIRDEDIRDYQGFDLCVWEENTDLPTLKVRRDMNYMDFVKQVASEYKVLPDKIRFWNFYRRQNRTIRPENPLALAKHHTSTMEDIYRLFGIQSPELRLYLEVTEHQVQDAVGKIVYFPDPSPDVITMFFKFYDAAHQKLKYVGNLRLKKSLKATDLVPLCTEMMKLPPNTALRLFEEIKPSMITPLKMKSTLKDLELGNGDIICFQIEPAHGTESQQFALAPSYYEHLQWLVTLDFYPFPKSKDNGADHTLGKHVRLLLSKRMKYDEVMEKLGHQVSADPEKLRIWVNPTGGDVPKTMITRNEKQVLHDILTTSFYPSARPFFWYEVTEMSMKELESRKAVSCAVIDAFVKEVDVIEGLVPKGGTLKDVQDLAVAKNPAFQNLRFFEVVHGKTLRRLPVTSGIAAFGESGAQLYAESQQVPELKPTADEKLTTIFHFNKDPARTHSVPFELILNKTMTVGQVKKRIQTRLSISDKEFTKLRIAAVSSGYKVRYLENDDDLLLDGLLSTESLALDHADKSAKKPGLFEKAIKIHN